MENLMSVAGIIFAIYLIIKLNRVVTVGIGVVNTTVSLADESVDVYATDVKINLAKKRSEQLDELSGMDKIPTTDDINAILEGKVITKDS